MNNRLTMGRIVVFGITCVSLLAAQQIPYDALMRGGRIHYDGQRYSRAREQFAKALEQYGGIDNNTLKAQIYAWLAASELKTGDTASAEGHLRAAMALDAASTRSLLARTHPAFDIDRLAVGPAQVDSNPAPAKGKSSASTKSTTVLTDSLLLGLPRGDVVAEAVAVVVGVSTYKEAPKVEFGSADARAVKEYLTKTFGYQEGNIIFLEDPGKADLEKVFGSASSPQGQLYNWVKPGQSDVFVYYTGHGAPSVKDRRGYLVPADGSPDYIEATGYPLELLYANLARVPAKSMTIVIDACFSGAATDASGRTSMLLKDASPLVVEPVPEDKTPDKAIVLTSATGKQISSWYPEKGHSLFTYWFLNGLKGAADVDKDGVIKLSELKAYLAENVTYTARRLYGRDQTPEVKGNANAEVLRLK